MDEEILIRYESKPSQSLTIDDVVSKAVENTTSKRKNFKNYELPGNYDTAISNFKGLIEEDTLRVINATNGRGLMGYSKDGIKIIVRPWSSSTEGPTIEYGKIMKVRYK